MADIAVMPKEVVSATSSARPANHAAWLEQLESAQWQQKLRYQPDSGGQARQGESEMKQISQGNTKNGALIINDNSAQHASAKAISNTKISHLQPTQGERIGQVLPQTSRLPLFSANLITTQTDMRTAADHEALLPPAYRPNLKASWQLQHSHAMLGTDGVRLWLRDARYDVRDGEALAHTLRKHFADLGMRLAQFTLNGQSVVGGESLGSTKEESWQ